MAEKTIDRLQIEIETESQKASDGLNRFIASLERVKSLTSGGTPELNLINQKFRELSDSVSTLKGKAASITSLATAIGRLSATDLSSISRDMSVFISSAEKLSTIGNSLQSVRDFSKGVTSLNTSFKKLKEMDLTGTSSKIQYMTKALKPLTDEMIRGGPAAASYGSAIKDLTQALRTANNAGKLTYQLTQSTKEMNETLKGGVNLTKFAAGFYVLREAGQRISGFIENINSYVEDINLFTVAMGDAAEKGEIFTQKMQDLLGIDAGEAMRNMGLFQQLVTSFGVSAEQAEVISKNFTQLGYDLSSFFNLPIEDSFEKLQSGIAGEIEPLRRIGIDLSAARLQQELYNLGIQENVNNLSQADKSLLRYIATMEQSVNAQTDLARTLTTPANQMRILTAQIDLAGRAIGSIFIPALNSVLPYVIAFVQVVREAASALASFLGFELPEIDYSNLDGASVTVGDMADNMGDLAGNTESTRKQLNRLISGFDELNILQKQAEGTGAAGAGASGTGNILGGIELPEYDMFEGAVESNVSEIVSSIKSGLDTIYKTLEPFFPMLTGLAEAIAAAFAVKKISDFIKYMKRSKVAVSVLQGLSSAAAAFDTAFTSTGKVLPSLNAGLKEFRNNLSPTTKAMVAIAGSVAVFGTTREAIKELTLGTIDFGTAMTNIIPIFALVEAGLYLVLGPWGLVAGAIAAAVGAIIGYNDAIKEQNRVMEESILYNGNAEIKLEEMAEYFSEFSDSIVRANEPFAELSSSISASRENILKTSDSIDTIATAINNGAYTAQEKLPEIKAAFETLYNETTSILDNIYDSIIRALSGSVGDVIQQMGGDVKTYTALISTTIAASKGNLEQYNSEVNEILNKISLGTATEQDIERLQELNSLIADLTYEVDKSYVSLQETVTSWSNTKIDMSNYETAFEQVKSSAASASESVENTFTELLSQIQTLQNQVPVGSEEWNLYENLAEATRQARDTELQKISNEVMKFVDAVDADYQEKLNEMVSTHKPEIEDLWNAYIVPSFSINGDETSYEDVVRESIEGSTLTPIRESLDELKGIYSDGMETVGEEGISSFALGLDNGVKATQNEILYTLTNLGIKASGELISAIVNAQSDVQQETINLLSQMSQGVSLKQPELEELFSGLGLELPDSLISSLSGKEASVQIQATNLLAQISQAGVEQRGPLITQLNNLGIDISQLGLEAGLKSRQSYVNQAGKDLESSSLSGAWEQFKKDEDEWAKLGEKAGSAFSKALNAGVNAGAEAIQSVLKQSQQNTPKNTSPYSNTSSSARSVPYTAFASGGVVDEPTFALIGEYQNARNNPEIVAPQSTIEESVVSANTQLVSAMYQMAQMMVEAVREGQNVSVQIDGKEIGKAAAEYIRDETKRTGRSPVRA